MLSLVLKINCGRRWRSRLNMRSSNIHKHSQQRAWYAYRVRFALRLMFVWLLKHIWMYDMIYPNMLSASERRDSLQPFRPPDSFANNVSKHHTFVHTPMQTHKSRTLFHAHHHCHEVSLFLWITPRCCANLVLLRVALRRAKPSGGKMNGNTTDV